MRTLENSLQFDKEKTQNIILNFIKKAFEDAKASGVVLGLSGGVDSSLTAALCSQALGKDKILGILMPIDFTPKEDVEDAIELAKMLRIRTERVHIDDICKTFINTLKISGNDPKTRIPLANIRARIRMVILYFYANTYNYLVAGTGDRSEDLIGYFTKHGDGAADFFPIRHLYKTQVRQLALHMGIPERIALKPSNPQLYPGHRLADEIPLDYDKLDFLLAGLFEYNLSAREISQMTNTPSKTIIEVQKRHINTEHKRKNPPRIEDHGPKSNPSEIPEPRKVG